MQPVNCTFCHSPLTVSVVERRNHTHSSYCPTCKYRYAISPTGQIINIQKRFSHKGTTWHATYRPDHDRTTFVVVKKIMPDADGIIRREEHKLPTFVSAERFLKLLIFL